MPFIMLIAAFTVSGICITWAGFVLSILWGWFMVPTFGLPVLSVPAAAGVALVVGYLAKEHKSDKEVTAEVMGAQFVNALILGAVFLFFGWAINLFM